MTFIATFTAAFICVFLLGHGLSPVSPDKAPWTVFSGFGEITKAHGEEKAKPRRKPKTRRVKTLKPKIYKRLTSAQKYLQDGNHAQALETLQDLLNRKDGISAYERAVITQNLAYVYIDKEQYSRAVQYLEQVLNSGALPEETNINLMYNIGQIYLVMEKPSIALSYIQRWRAEVKEPNPSANIFLAQIYLQLGKIKQATAAAEMALAKAENPRESWFQLMAALYIQQKMYKKALPVLEKGVAIYPANKPMWSNLASIYGLLNDEKKSFAARKSMYRQGFLTKSSEIVHLAQLYLYHGVPYKAGQVLEKGFQENRVEEKKENLELLSNAWMYAREWGKATSPLRKAAELSDNGKLYIRLGQNFIKDEKWQEAAKAVQKGLKKGKLQDEGRAWLLLGIAQYKGGALKGALKGFRKAEEYKSSALSAAQWIRSLERQIAQKEKSS